ncbi:L-threonylcarbamoyladenylate synthase [Synechocystis sp. LKSZ1]|uniref:L-threonylcarbamoyladenylate synthase n=1 Tax=Synechocystis sp. LKSZ1 TaxID=3144951 RepID=UPI00336C1E0E
MALTQTVQILKPSLGIVPQLLQHLEQDRVVLLPMDTVYTLVAHGARPQAIAALRQLKNFDKDQPLGMLTRGDRAEEVVQTTPASRRMMAHFPCPITMIMTAQPHLDQGITQGFANIFVACPDPFIYDLIGAIPFPLVSATAKVGGEPITSFQAAQRYFSHLVPVIVDGGVCRYSRRGTLIDFTLPIPTIMNFGPMSVDDLRPLLPEIILPSHLMK